jgi:hypothetical protein
VYFLRFYITDKKTNGSRLNGSKHYQNSVSFYFPHESNFYLLLFSDIQTATKQCSCHDFEVEIAIAKLKKYKSPGSVQIPAELIQAGGDTLLSAIHKIINCVWDKEELSDQWNESIIVPVHKKGEKTDCNNFRGISIAINFIQNFIEYPLKVKSIYR